MPPAPRTVPLTRLRSEPRTRLEALIALTDTAARVVRLAEKTLARHSLTLPQFDVLSNLAMHDNLTQNDLAARMQVTKGNVCGLLDRLEKLGYVRRRSDERDARINRLSITATGRERVDALRPVHDAALIAFADAWSADDADTLIRIVLKLNPQEPS